MPPEQAERRLLGRLGVVGSFSARDFDKADGAKLLRAAP